MTHDEIIEMARQAGLVFDAKKPEISVYPPALLSFAKLVAAKEHEWLIGYIRIHQPSCEQMANAIRARGEA